MERVKTEEKEGVGKEESVRWKGDEKLRQKTKEKATRNRGEYGETKTGEGKS